MAASIPKEKIGFNFYYQGLTKINGGCSQPGGATVKKVCLTFEQAKTLIHVNIPDDVSQTTSQRLCFTCQKSGSTTQTTPESLSAAPEQIKGLKIFAEVHKKSTNPEPYQDDLGRVSQKYRLNSSHQEALFNTPDNLEVGKMYKLTFYAGSAVLIEDQIEFIFSSNLEKEEKTTSETPRKPTSTIDKEEYKKRLGQFGEALINEGLNNLDIAETGGGSVFNSSTTTADVYAHGIQGVVRAGKETMNPNIEVPYSKPTISSSELDNMSIKALQACFEDVCIKDKTLETARMKAGLAGHVKELNALINEECENSQLLLLISEALRRKGVIAQIPQSEAFQNAQQQSTDSHQEAFKKLEENCKTQ